MTHNFVSVDGCSAHHIGVWTIGDIDNFGIDRPPFSSCRCSPPQSVGQSGDVGSKSTKQLKIVTDCNDIEQKPIIFCHTSYDCEVLIV